MTDIVEELRLLHSGAQWADKATADTLEAAAYEIEKLRSALQELLADTQHSRHSCGDPDCPVDRARKTLEGGR